MVFYIIAAGVKGKDENDCARFAKDGLNVAGRVQADLFNVNVRISFPATV
jgi:hypothetical protein